jgi:ABC-type uncharacterized transport system permease subunit
MKTILTLILLYITQAQILASSKIIVLEKNSNNIAIITNGLLNNKVINKYKINNTKNIVFHKDNGYFISEKKYLININLQNIDKQVINSKKVKELSNISNIVISPDGKFLALAKNKEILILNLQNYKIIHKILFKDSTTNMIWSKHTQDIYVSEASTSIVWTIDTNEWFKEREIYQIQNPSKIFEIN